MYEGRHECTSRQTTANTPTQPLQMCRIICSFLVVRFSFNCVGVFVFIRTTRIHLSRAPFTKEKQRYLFILSNYCFFFFFFNKKQDVNGFICTHFLVTAVFCLITQIKCDRPSLIISKLSKDSAKNCSRFNNPVFLCVCEEHGFFFLFQWQRGSFSRLHWLEQ